jgi:hypothetical protein
VGMKSRSVELGKREPPRAPGESKDFNRSESWLYQASVPFPSGSLEFHPSVVS